MNIILNYKIFESNLKNDITIEIINGRYWDFILEKFNFEYYNNYKKIKLKDEHKIKLQSIEEVIESKLEEINPFVGIYYNPNIKKERVINFNILTTEHWYTKFFREYYESPSFVTPDLYEGLDIITNNINEITRLIDVGLILNNYKVLIKSRSTSYSEIVHFNRVNSRNYNIYLITQMKGKNYLTGEMNRTIKLPPKT